MFTESMNEQAVSELLGIGSLDKSYSLGPYHPEHAQSHLVPKAKQGWAWSVLAWETSLYGYREK
jgi:hypothetical protein